MIVSEVPYCLILDRPPAFPMLVCELQSKQETERGKLFVSMRCGTHYMENCEDAASATRGRDLKEKKCVYTLYALRGNSDSLLWSHSVHGISDEQDDENA